MVQDFTGEEGGQSLHAEGKVCTHHCSGLHKELSGFIGSRNHYGTFTEKADLEGGIKIAVLRREVVQAGLRPRLRDGHDTVRGQQVDHVASICGLCKAEMGEICRKVDGNHSYP